MSFLIDAFRDGGFFMYPIALMLSFGIIIIVERLYMILQRYNTDSSKVMQEVQGHIVDNNIDKALKLCNQNKHAAICQVFKAALLNADRPYEEIQDHVEVATMAVVPKLQKRVAYLFTIANVATLIGLLGTIVGLVKTFQAVGAVEGAQKQILLSVGISTAMNTTAFGLICAIPCMLCYGYLHDRINNIIDEISHYSARLLMLLRTGSEYYDNFNAEPMASTKQDPKVKNMKDYKENEKNEKNDEEENLEEDKKNAS